MLFKDYPLTSAKILRVSSCYPTYGNMLTDNNFLLFKNRNKNHLFVHYNGKIRAMRRKKPPHAHIHTHKYRDTRT